MAQGWGGKESWYGTIGMYSPMIDAADHTQKYPPLLESEGDHKKSCPSELSNQIP